MIRVKVLVVKTAFSKWYFVTNISYVCKKFFWKDFRTYLNRFLFSMIWIKQFITGNLYIIKTIFSSRLLFALANILEKYLFNEQIESRTVVHNLHQQAFPKCFNSKFERFSILVQMHLGLLMSLKLFWTYEHWNLQ